MDIWDGLMGTRQSLILCLEKIGPNRISKLSGGDEKLLEQLRNAVTVMICSGH
jgi:hypothetical protein